jgi:hypothetical protein
VSGGKPVLLEGVDLPLWGLEVDVEEGKREFAAFSAKNNTADQVWDHFVILPCQRVACASLELSLIGFCSLPASSTV